MESQGGEMKHLNTRLAMLVCAIALGYVDFYIWKGILTPFLMPSSPNTTDATAAVGFLVLFFILFAPVLFYGAILLGFLTYWFFACCYFIIFPEQLELPPKEPKNLI